MNYSKKTLRVFFLLSFCKRPKNRLELLNKITERHNFVSTFALLLRISTSSLKPCLEKPSFNTYTKSTLVIILRRNYLHSLYIDFKKSFDKVNHERLLFRFYTTGIQRRASVFFAVTFTTDTIKLGLATISEICVHSGVPHESVLGLVLYKSGNFLTVRVSCQVAKDTPSRFKLAGKDPVTLLQPPVHNILSVVN